MLRSARVPDDEHAFFYFQRPEVQQNQGFTAGFLQAAKEPQHPVSVLQSQTHELSVRTKLKG